MQGSRPESGNTNPLEIQAQKRKHNESWKVRGDYFPMEEDFFSAELFYDFMWNGFTEPVYLLSEDTQVETQSNNIKLEPIL